ncbi:hypothetical protein BDP27DRAFT_315963 [Rhodocollybia butyracea]|uniref:Uncharacterized protein n=1 Tax=Rhodocollybia butyracea TaxID=206335 RepID=A0A9P5UBL3_9AGAR|nr:hypothetical protein BDP27DRAFT_315963 [Rhodocollybia butyracea]
MPMVSYTLRPDATIYAVGFVVTKAQIEKMAASLCPTAIPQYCSSVSAFQWHVDALQFEILPLDPPKLDETRYLFIINFIPGLKGRVPHVHWSDSTKKQWWEMFGKFGGFDANLKDLESLAVPYPANISPPTFMLELLIKTLKARPELRDRNLPRRIPFQMRSLLIKVIGYKRSSGIR